MTKEDLMDVLGTLNENSRGDHLIADCPFCRKKGHFYVNHIKAFQTDAAGKFVPCWDCKKCGYNGNIYYLLKYIDALHIIVEPVVKITSKLKIGALIDSSVIEDDDREKLDLELPKKKLPVGFRRLVDVRNDKLLEYLTKRGFSDYEFSKYNVGFTNFKRELKDYVIFTIYDNREVRGWFARYSGFKLPSWVLKYRNSKNIDSSKMLLGYDELNFLTKTVILVEGIFDKIRIDQALKLNTMDSTIKCCCTFGKSLSRYQIEKLMLKGVRVVVLGYDPDAISAMKRIGIDLSRFFDKVMVCCDLINFKDFGASSDKEIIRVFNGVQNFKDFRLRAIYQQLR